MPKEEYTGLSVKKELMEIVKQFIKDYPEFGYRTLGQFAEDAIRRRMDELNVFALTPRFSHFNLDEHGVKIGDKKFGLKAIQIYFKPEGIFCEYCGTSNCEHIKYALEQKEIQKIIRKKCMEGWKLPNV